MAFEKQWQLTHNSGQVTVPQSLFYYPIIQRTTPANNPIQQTPKCSCPISRNTHCSDVIISAMASQITSLTIVYSTIYSGASQRKHQSFASLAFVRGIHRWPVNSPHKGPVTRKMFPFGDAIMTIQCAHVCSEWCIAGLGTGALLDVLIWSTL